MTKVQLTFPLSRPLSEDQIVSISHMHAVYGFIRVRLNAAMDELFVEYDASRLSPKEVRASLEQNGIPLAFPPATPPADTSAPTTLAG